MRYFYEPKSHNISIFGEIYTNSKALYRSSTLYLYGDRGLCIVRYSFDPKTKSFYYSHLDGDLANDIYLTPGFKEYFETHATCADEDGLYFTVDVRKVMWALRMKPLRKEAWECDIY